MCRPTSRRLSLLALLLLLSCFPSRLEAHGQPVQLAFWGGFTPTSVSRCQRVIAAAAARCVQETVVARQKCYLPALSPNGEPCPASSLNEELAAIRQRARSAIPSRCTNADLMQLIYADLFDVFDDVVDVCRRLDTAATTAIFGPALAGGSVPGPVEPERAMCISATGEAATRLLTRAITERRTALDHIASARGLDPDQKLALVDLSRQRTETVRQRLENWIADQCPAAQFEASYGQDSHALLESVSQQAECFAEYVYVQDTVVCPAPVCGNGVREPNEDCDDGNDRADDGCNSMCRRT